MREVRDPIVRMDEHNAGLGYTRIQGALSNVGHRVVCGIVANVLRERGIEPAPQKGKRTRWSTLLKAHWRVRGASDFSGITPNPTDPWMLQAVRNLLDVETGVLNSKRCVIIDRDAKYTDSFVQVLASAGIQVIRLPPASPNLNAYAERFERSIKKECLE